MDKKNDLKNKIVQANIVESLKAFLLLNIDKFDDEQIDWLIANL